MAQRDREEADPAYRRLKIGLIFSYQTNEDEPDGLLADEEFETEGLDQSSREFLEDAIQDYNDLFGTSYDTSREKFENYYKDFSLRLRNRELDIALVVNMFLTGFDATTLNTLWVDKNLRQHGLIQAFSRTNRILNSVKTFGNIVSFRNLEDATTDALQLFGNKDAGGIVLLKPFRDYYEDYRARVAELADRYPLGTPIIGERAQKGFIEAFGAILRLRNILTAFDEFSSDDLLSERDLQDYQSIYLNFYQDLRQQTTADKESINDDVVFEIELIKQVEVNVDYILMLVQRYLDEHGTGQDIQTRETISRAIDASPSLRNKKDLVDAFVDSLTVTSDVDTSWRSFITAKQSEELDRIITDENLKPAATREFVDNASQDGPTPTTGTAVTKILPPTSRFSAANNHAAKKQIVLDKLSAFLDRFLGLL